MAKNIDLLAMSVMTGLSAIGQDHFSISSVIHQESGQAPQGDGLCVAERF
jgi:hypothetical protein